MNVIKTIQLLALILLSLGSFNLFAQEQVPQTNAEIRQWYNNQVSIVPQLNEVWIKEGLSAQQRAKKAYKIRHNARVKAREMMADKGEVSLLRERDQQKYGNPDGPTLDYLLEKNRTSGLTGDAVYEEIIDSSKRTNKEYNKKFSVKNQN